MTISDEQYNTWLKRRNVQRDLLFIATHSAGTEYFSLLGKTTTPNDTPANTAFVQRFVEFPSLIIESINADKAIGDISVVNNGIDHWQDYNWQSIDVFLGDSSWLVDDYRKIISVVIDDVNAGADVFTFITRDKKALLEVPANDNYVLGQVNNISPELIDSTHLIYRFHPDNTAIVDGVRDNGVPLVVVTDYTVNNNGSFALISSAAGKITCDAHHLSINNTAEVCQFIAELVIGSSDIDTANLLDFSTNANNAPLGIYLTKGSDLSQWITDIAASVGSIWRFNARGLFQLIRFELPKANNVKITPGIIALNSVDLVSKEQPYLSVEMQYQYNWTIQDESQLSATLSASDRQYYASQAKTVKADNSVILNGEYPLATKETRTSYFVNQSDTQSEAQRIANQRKVIRKIYRLTAFIAPFSVLLCDSAHITYNRFGFDEGLNAVIISRQQNTANGSMECEVWL
jgi:hypothetical protein